MRSGFLVILFAFSALVSEAQFRKDTVKNLYGPSTSRFFTDDMVFENRDTTYQVDTILENQHLFEFVDRWGEPRQDLGGLGTANRSLYYESPTETGQQLGMEAYSVYEFKQEDIKYHNTRSPFTQLQYVQGGNGTQFFTGEFARNITPNAGIGLNIRRFTSIHQIGQNPNQEGWTDHYAARVVAHYKTRNNKYRALANYSWMKHTVDENGGLHLDSLDVLPDSLFGLFENHRMDDIEVQDRRYRWYLYHQYSVIDTLNTIRLFHEAKRIKRANQYSDASPSATLASTGESNNDFYDTTYWSSGAILDSTEYLAYENKGGVALKIGDWNASGHIRHRWLRYAYNLDTVVVGPQQEVYLGGQLWNTSNSGIQFNGMAEVSQAGYLHLKGVIKTKFSEVSGYMLNYPSSLAQQRQFGSYYRWDTTFANSQDIGLKGKLKYANDKMDVKAGAEYLILNNLVYFDTTHGPVQSEKAVTQLRLFADVKFSLGKFVFKSFNVLSSTSNEDVVMTPRLYNQNQVFFKSRIFRKMVKERKVYMLIGVDSRWKSSYNGYDYNPSTQQFETQNHFDIYQSLTLDAFASFQLRTMNFFFRYAHVNQGLFNPGYFTAPYYVGKRRTFEFGFYWKFYN